MEPIMRFLHQLARLFRPAAPMLTALAAAPQLPTALHLPTPGLDGDRADLPRPGDGAPACADDIECRRLRYALPAGRSSTLKKTMRLARWAAGTRGRDTMAQARRIFDARA
jgi:hypothetical protein